MVIPGRRTIVRNEIIVNRRPAAGVPELPERVFTPRPFDAAEVRNRAETVGRFFTRHGYPYVSVSTELRDVEGRDSVDLVFHIDPDRRYRFAVPELKGLFSTGKSLLIRDIAVKPGAFFDHEAIEQSLERLRSRSYITEVSALPPLISSLPGDSACQFGLITAPFMIRDRSGMGLDGALGLEAGDGETPRVNGNLQFSFVNLFRAGEEAELAYAGERERQRLDLRLSLPRLFGLPLTIDAKGGLEVISREYGYLYGGLGFYSELGVRWLGGMDLLLNNVSRSTEDGQESRSFIGVDLVLSRSPEPLRDGAWSRHLLVATGSGLTRKEKTFRRSHLDFSAGGQIPLFRHQALTVRGMSGHIFTREDNLVPSEMYRVGGASSIRGYAELEFAFRTVLYGQAEYLYYFQHNAAIYVFADGGIGFTGALTDPYRKMLGYGLGVRLPSRIGTVSFEWARNMDDTRNPGRIHVGFKNSFSNEANRISWFSRR